MVISKHVALRNKSNSDFHLLDINGRAYVLKPNMILSTDDRQGKKLVKDFPSRLELLDIPSVILEAPKPKKTTKEEK